MILSPVKHYKFPVVFHHGRIKCSSRLEAFSLGRNDWLVGLSIPLSKVILNCVAVAVAIITRVSNADERTWRADYQTAMDGIDPFLIGRF